MMIPTSAKKASDVARWVPPRPGSMPVATRACVRATSKFESSLQPISRYLASNEQRQIQLNDG